MKAPIVSDKVKPIHISCNIEDIADTVIMPGDPLRAKFIAEKFLSDAKLVNTTRNMFAYTGYYKNKKVTVMGSGMGMPSMGIYAFELYYFFGVEKIIRIGSCGGSVPELQGLDIVLASESYTEGNFAYSYNGNPTHFTFPNRSLNEKIKITAEKLNQKLHIGTVMCTEQFDFYSDYEHVMKRVPKNTTIIAGEMESFALFHTAASLDKQASCLLTVVDSKFHDIYLTSAQRETSLDKMIILALESVL